MPTDEAPPTPDDPTPEVTESTSTGDAERATAGVDAATPAPDRRPLIAAACAVVLVILVAGVLIARSRSNADATVAASPTTAPTTTAAPLPLTDGSALPGTTTEAVPFDSVPAETFAPHVTSPPNTFTLPPAPYQVAVPKNAGKFPIYQSVGDTSPVRTMDNPRLINPKDPATAVPLHFLVRGSAGNGWLEVFLPVRPNGSTGFVKDSDVTIASHNFHIEVRLSQFNLKAFDGTKVLLDVPIAVASSNSPTPGGLYYTTELIKPPPKTGYGTYAYGLSGHSDTYETFNGGDGQLGIHGTDDPSSIGRAVSHGCIRMRNSDIEQLVPILPLGVPVQIYA